MRRQAGAKKRFLMQITTTLIRALASLPADEIAAQYNRALQAFLQDPNAIVSASDGAGQSYTRHLSGTAQEMLELWQSVKDWVDGVDAPGDTQIYHNVVIAIPNR